MESIAVKEKIPGLSRVIPTTTVGIFLMMVLALFVMAFLGLNPGILWLFFGLASWLTWQRSELGLLWLIVAMPILPMLKITQTIENVTLVRDIIILTLFCRVLLLTLKKQLPYRRNIFLAPIIGLTAWSIIEAWRADIFWLGILRLRDILLYILLYFGVLYLPASRSVWLERLRWFGATLVVVAVLGIYQLALVPDSMILRYDPVREIWIGRISSIMAHPSIFGHYLIIGITLLIPLGLMAETWRRRLMILTLTLLLLVEVWLTYSRAVWIGLAAAGGCWLVADWYRRGGKGFVMAGQRKMIVSLTGLMIILAVMVSAYLSGLSGQGWEYLKKLAAPSYRSNEERLGFIVRLIAPMTNVEAITGRGLGDVIQQNLRTVNVEAYQLASIQAQAVQEAKDETLVDNQYLKTWVEMGLIGLIIYGWLFIRFFKGVWEITSKKNFQFSSLRRGYGRQAIINFQTLIGWWGMGFLVFFMVQGFFIDVWEIFPTNAYFWIIGAMVSLANGQGNQVERLA